MGTWSRCGRLEVRRVLLDISLTTWQLNSVHSVPYQSSSSSSVLIPSFAKENAHSFNSPRKILCSQCLQHGPQTNLTNNMAGLRGKTKLVAIIQHQKSPIAWPDPMSVIDRFGTSQEHSRSKSYRTVIKAPSTCEVNSRYRSKLIEDWRDLNLQISLIALYTSISQHIGDLDVSTHTRLLDHFQTPDHGLCTHILCTRYFYWPFWAVSFALHLTFEILSLIESLIIDQRSTFNLSPYPDRLFSSFFEGQEVL